jgi:hypothetical protein
VNQPQAVGHGAGSFADVREGAVEVVHQVEKREDDVALPSEFRVGALAPHTPAVVVELRQRAQAPFALGVKFRAQAFDLRL